eukprot:TRINITY_DN2722_c0_g1_i1.p1 TRINITY_DN2722_c0_g1~~TRINITY_DN2722_c0_g1_i1.p1  ORF type:complete len:220 (-),score=42.72 TRINITY_DN2722_c0_g1_i1:155-763(-)
MAQYGKKDYWEDRYAKDSESFDWFQKFEGLKAALSKHIKDSDKVLNVGCGNSTLSEELYDAGVSKNITNIDVSTTVIKQMSEKHAGKDGLTFTVMNATSLHFSPATYDVIIDKGTLDCVLCAENSTHNSDKMLSELSRVLKAGGRVLYITYASPEIRKPLLDKPKYGWTIETISLPKPTAPGVTHDDPDAPKEHTLFVLTKH